MPVRRSSSQPNVARLVEALASPDAQQRESAAARLTIVGRPAVPQLRALVAAGTAAAEARIAALRTLTGIAGADLRPSTAAALASDVDALAREGIDVLHTMLHDATDEAAATAALEQLTELALAAAAPLERRLAAVDALAGLPDVLLTPIHRALAADPEPVVAARVRAATTAGTSSPSFDDVLTSGRLPDAAATMASVVREAAAAAPVTDLRRAIDLVRARERQEEPRDGRRAAWTLVRGQLHRALADRGSRIARYDLREALEQPDVELSVDFLAAAILVADVSCLDALTTRWVAAADSDRWRRDQLEQAVRAVIERDRLTRADPVLVKLLTRLPASAPLVALAPRKRR